MFRKNVASQFFHFQGVDATTGGIKSGVTWTVRRCIDGTFAAATGTVTEDGTTGWYKFALSQADTNGNNVGFNFTGTGAVPQTVNIITTAADPTDAVRLGLTALPNAAAEAAGGLFTRGSGAGQINQPANGQIDSNAVKVGGTTQTGRDIGASVLLAADQAVNTTKLGGTPVTARDIGASVLVSPGTGTGQVDLSSGKVLLQATQTGVTIPTVTTLTNAPSDSSGVTTLLSRLSALRAGYLDNLSAGAAALESSLQSLITTIGAAGAGLTATASAVWSVATRLLTAGTNIVLAKGTGVTGFNDLSAAAVNAEADTALADYDGPTHAELTSELATADDATLTAIGALNNLSTGDIPTAERIAGAVWSSLSFPTTPIVDDFNRPDEGPPPTGWITGIAEGLEGFTEPGFDVIGNELANSFNDFQQIFRDEEWGPDCEGYITVKNTQDLRTISIVLRLTDVGQFTSNGYVGKVTLTDGPSGGFNVRYSIYRLDAGEVTGLDTLLTFEPGDLIDNSFGFRCKGDSMQMWANLGNGWQHKLTVSDTSYASAGKPGLVSDGGPFSRLDDFGGGTMPLPGEVIADKVWDEDIVSAHQDEDTAGKKLSQALVLYEEN